MIYSTYTSGGGKHEQDQKTVVLEEAEWEGFWIAVRNIGVWYWRKAYDDIRVCDGIEWQLEFALADKEIKSQVTVHMPQMVSIYRLRLLNSYFVLLES